ncbi:large subunit ribosomal protein L36e [Paragonimus westermani]|uniref:Large ribosomal subunit protein eL36 n=1 Tax=Paragonimus westermani TaxID=34504 RepID=A0A5J4NTP9_9TREM|nr:large subunit ribosomal protein L36e [Paragonimus westermani]
MGAIRRYPVCVGRERGIKKTKNVQPKKPSNRRGRITKQAKFTRDLIREIVGFAPFEKRILELLKNDREKRALKFAKKRVGGTRRAKKKREELLKIVKSMRTK